EVLGRELLAEMLADVLVQPPCAEVDELAVVLVAKQPPAAGHGEQLLDRGGQLLVREHRSAEDTVLGAEAKRDLAPAHLDVSLAQRGDPERSVRLRVAL